MEGNCLKSFENVIFILEIYCMEMINNVYKNLVIRLFVVV